MLICNFSSCFQVCCSEKLDSNRLSKQNGQVCVLATPIDSGSPQDDMLIRVFNYNTLEKVHSFEAHSDYIRAIVVHPTHPYILTSSG